MTEFNKLMCFNAFHIVLVAIISNIISNIIINNNYESLLNAIYYLINIELCDFWILMTHIIITYILLINLTFEIGFRGAIKFNL